MSLNKKRVGIQRKGCDANGVISRVLNLLSPQFKLANIKLRLFLSKKLPFVAIDHLELDEIVMNITSNALEAMPNGGVFSIKTSFQKTQNLICIEFRDDGIGIPGEILPRVFEPFFTTKQRGLGQNAGLGLSVVYSIVKDCKGEVSIKSNLRLGTIVTILLPVVHRQKSTSKRKKISKN